ncbi:MAG: NERD domain-containing protein [Vulcanimicrobiaceae bacterium]
MQITRLDPDGIQPRESLGIGALQDQLPQQWFGFANLMMRSGGRDKPREIDLVFITHDRIIIVDLKDWLGTVESREGVWYQNGRQREPSPATKLAMNARRLKTLLENEARELGHIPWVEHFVVFTNPSCDFSRLEPADFANGVVSLQEFIKLLRSQDAYDKRFRRSETWARFRPLTEGTPQQILRRFFRGPERFTPREVIFDQYRPVGDPVFEHPRGVYQEFVCDHIDNPSYQALLRYWDFEALPTQASVAADRKSIAGREHAVLGYLLKIDPQLYDDAVMQSQSRDNDFQMHYWELFQLRRTMRRINEYLVKRSPDLDRRFAIASMLISRVAQLHRDTVAHRDLGSHSVWYDERQSRVILSAFGAAHFPERHTIGDLRLRLIAATSRLPEDIEESGVERGTPFQQDVFLVGALVWEILSGKAVAATAEGVVDWTSAQFDAGQRLPAGLRDFFAKALSWEPSQRFDSAVTMHDAFVAAIRRNEPDLHISLDAYERDTAPFLLYPATATLSTGRSTAWISGTGDTRVAVKLWAISAPRELATKIELSRFLQTADDLKSRRPAWTPEVVDYGIWNNNLYIATRFVAAESLEGRYSELIDVDNAYGFCLGLINAISELHSARETHGDVSPSNILVERDSDGNTMPLLIDIPDYAAPDEGELTTSAYAPQRYADPYTRDRYGLAKILSEVLSATGAEVSDDTRESRLLSAALRCTDGQDAGLTIRPMLAAIEESKRREKVPSAVMRVGVRNLNDERQFLGNDGLFSVVLDESAATLYVVGLDEQLEIRVSRDKLAPVSVMVRPASVGALNWAETERILTFESIVRLYPALQTDAEDLGWLWARPEIATQLSALRAGAAAAPIDEIHHVPVQELKPAPSLQTETAKPVIDVSKLWLATIEVEDEELVEIHVTGRPSWDPAHRVHLVPCDFSSTDLDLDARQATSVVFNGRIIGDVDVDLMTSTELPIRGMREHVRLYAGAKLMLQSRQDWDNLSRRRRAVKRVLDNEAVIHRLLDYFKLDSDMEPLSFPDATPTARDLDRYELSATQREAFERLWSLGPVGLLQGPPGTGKTRFIASFVHYALTEGGMHNALLLSQSHEAVNNAAESLLKIFGADIEPLSLLRVGGRRQLSWPVDDNYLGRLRA